MAALVLLLSILTRLVGERIGINNGQGWDGELYVRWATDFKRQVLLSGTTKYHAQRVLPSGVLYYAMQLVGARPSLPNLLLAFHVLDTVMLMFAALLWAHLGEVMKWRVASIWVGFAALFLGFANARHALYYPALTDSTAFALGMTVAWAYLARRAIALFVCVALCMWTWPGLTPVAVVCLLVPRLTEELPEPAARWRWWIRGAAMLVALAATAEFMLLARHYLAHPVDELGIPKFATWVRRDWLSVTVPLLVAFLAITWFTIVDQPRLWNAVAYVRTIRWLRTALVIVGVAVLWYARKRWLAAVVTQGEGPTTAQFACLQTLEALRGPLWGPVHHVVYFGPIVAVAAVYWRSVCRVVGTWGHAAVFAFAMLVVFLAASESRQWIHLLPLVVAAVVTATDARWTHRRAILFVAIALAWSKLWLRIGYTTPGDWRTFPTQRYFMNLGPWASDTSWMWHGLAAIVTVAAMWLLLRSSPGAHRESSRALPDPASAPR